MANKRTYLNRIEKLATFLDTLPRREFDFHQVVAQWNPERSCGSICCAIGWTPVVFPRSWAWKETSSTSEKFHTACLKGYAANWDDAAERFFGLTRREVKEGFYPAENLMNDKGALPGNSTPKRVARNLRRIARKFQPQVKKVPEPTRAN